MEKDYSIYIKDILESINYIEMYINGISQESFMNDIEKQDAVLRRLEIIGEAAARISETIRINNPVVPWKKVIGLRNIIIHNYMEVDMKIIWAIIKDDLPETKKLFEDLLK